MNTGPEVAIVAVVDTIAMGTTVGAKRAGLLCMPDGTARWRDFDPPGAATLTRTVAAALRARQIEVSGDDDVIYGPASDPPRRIVRVSLLGAELTLCRTKFGIAGQRVRGTLTVRWEEFDRAARRSVAIDDYRISIEAKDLPQDGPTALLLNAVTRSADRWATERGMDKPQY